MTEESKEQKPNFKTWEEVDEYHRKKNGVKTVDRTKDLEGKAIVWFPGRVYEIQDPEDE